MLVTHSCLKTSDLNRVVQSKHFGILCPVSPVSMLISGSPSLGRHFHTVTPVLPEKQREFQTNLSWEAEHTQCRPDPSEVK